MYTHLLHVSLMALLMLSGSQCRYMGCYKEISKKTRLLPDEFKDFGNSLTPDMCRNYCKEKNFSYAGVQIGRECFCSIARPPFQASADESDCNTPCKGETSRTCGGEWRLSVYDIVDKNVNYVEKYYIGCFKDTESRTLNRKYIMTNWITPEHCVSFCYRWGYRYAGVESHNQCFCGDEIRARQISEVSKAECDWNCIEDSRFMCGGTWRAGIYSTSIPDESEDGKLVGCFVDSNTRLLQNYKIWLHETNTPRRCFNICKQLGFKFSGVEVGLECYCGNVAPDRDRLTNENECYQKCRGGDIHQCGGNWRIMIYSTT